jgi:hypothetical protein
MEAAIGYTTPIDLRHLNQCRLFLKVQRLSDLYNGAGTELLPKALSQNYTQHNNESDLTWPRQGEPSLRARTIWKRTLRRLFLTDRAGPLQSLGKWLEDEGIKLKDAVQTHCKNWVAVATLNRVEREYNVCIDGRMEEWKNVLHPCIDHLN